MIVLKQILVATDFSDASAAAMDYGRALARTFGASLHLLHVIENPFLRPTAADPQTIKNATLRHLFDRLTDDDRRTLHATAVLETSDDPADEIVKYARAQADRPHRHGHARARNRRADPRGQRRGESRAAGAVPGAHRPSSGA